MSVETAVGRTPRLLKSITARMPGMDRPSGMPDVIWAAAQLAGIGAWYSIGEHRWRFSCRGRQFSVDCADVSTEERWRKVLSVVIDTVIAEEGRMV